MKVYIITIHCIHNFGSVLQSYALVRFLREHNYDAEIIDYCPDYYSRGRNAFKNMMSRILNLRHYWKQHKLFQQFINEEIPKTVNVYRTFDDLKSIGTENAIFIAGGDQLWNTFHSCGNDDAYKLTFAEGKFKLAYGTSMGRNTFSDDELQELSSKVTHFSSIGLRELSTVQLLKPYVEVPVYHAADPVLLLNKEAYRRFIGPDSIISEPYLLVYLARKSQLLENTVSTISKKLGLKVVLASGFRKKCTCDYFLKSPGPKELLNLIYYSNYVVSASFHASLFSILFEKQFATLLPEKGTNTRIEDLLHFFNISSRIVKTVNDEQLTEEKVNYADVTPKVMAFAEQSRINLLNALRNLD